MASANDLGSVPRARHKGASRQKKDKKKMEKETLATDFINVVEAAAKSFDRIVRDVKKLMPKDALKNQDRNEDFWIAEVEGNRNGLRIAVWADESLSDRFTIVDRKTFKELHSSKDLKEFMKKLKLLLL